MPPLCGELHQLEAPKLDRSLAHDMHGHAVRLGVRRPIYAAADARFDAKASMAVMIPMALCRSRLPLPKLSMALHQATASSGEARRRSVSDFAPSAIALLRS